ncbi:hypothetical protein Y032_0067g60 [Ancylostoma ceylanicum]|uniref:Uncharacterized protein n=1 Tax=Ancylostoma ceylanicum TaxID=53326 RepID=A0A016U0S4_9BILA|nr:hypothetical protein Y032_0067g60 [Ancylostoma ceylanicum]
MFTYQVSAIVYKSNTSINLSKTKQRGDSQGNLRFYGCKVCFSIPAMHLANVFKYFYTNLPEDDEQVFLCNSL